MDELASLSAVELLKGYRARRFSPVEVVDALAVRIDHVNPLVGAFTTVCLDRARAEARAAEAAYHKGEADGALLGVPFASKDIFDTAGVRTTYGSAMFRDHVPAADASAVRRARAAGAIFVGKTATHEFAWGVTSVNPSMGTSRNPWAPDRISGGSSGGSATALATRLVPIALGTDTGGSIRVPSGFCGTVGLKPTFGRISLAGAWPLARTLDHAGPMARTVEDAELLLGTLAGEDPADPASVTAAPWPSTPAGPDLGGTTVGVCPGPLLTGDHRDVFDDVVRTLESLGARLVEAGLPDAGHIRTRFAELFTRLDLLVAPVSGGPPVPIGEESVLHGGREIPFREFVMPGTVPQNLTGLPACAVRAGFDALGLPVGVQFTGPWWNEPRVLAAARAFTDATPETQRRRPEPSGHPGTGGRNT